MNRRLLIGFLIISRGLLAQFYGAGTEGGVVSVSQLASQVGVDILRAGGNAVDAAIATGFALAVVHPEAGNIGGGGFMLIRFPDGRSTAIDFREKAPGRAHRDMYLDADGNPISGQSLSGPLAAGIPGSVAGYWLAWQRYGSLPWRTLVKPAARLARCGFIVDGRLNRSLASHAGLLNRFPASRSMFFPDGQIPQIGTRLQFPELAHTLDRIAVRGAQEFYYGLTAQKLVWVMQQDGGIFTAQDLADYQAVERTPLRFSYRGYELITMPPPSSGGVCIAQFLHVLAHFDFEPQDFLSARHIQLFTETARQVYANRAHYLGDPDFVTIPLAALTGDSLAAAMAGRIDLTRATPSSAVSFTPLPESEQTTHFSVIDHNHLAVAVTTTLNTGYGSAYVAAGTGILLNNEMDDFSVKPGHPNFYGLLGSEANAIQPGKRMLSSMSPTIIARHDSLMWVLGSPGGSTIITAVTQVIMNLIDFNMTLPRAVDAPRFHHQWLPDTLFYEHQTWPSELRDMLTQRGYTLLSRGNIANVNAAGIDWSRGWLMGAPDKRRNSAAVCY